MNVMFYEVFQEEKRALRNALPRDIKAEFTAETIQTHGSSAQPPADIISIRTQSIIPPEWAASLRGILTRSTGYDHLLKYRRETQFKGACGYLAPYCSQSVAEHAILMMLALMRRMKKQQQQFESFLRDGITGQECCGKNILVVGVGHIGSNIVDFAQGLKMNVKGVDIAPKLKSIEHVSLSEGVAWADVLVSAVPLTEKTEGMLNYAVLTKARKGIVLINVSRGEVTPVADMQRLLDEERLGGLSMDVFPEEAMLAEKLRGHSAETSSSTDVILKLKDQNNVILTPHNAFNTIEAVRRKAQLSAAAIVQFLESKSFPSPIPST